MSKLFGLLKKKLSGFTEKLKKKVEKKPEALHEKTVSEETMPNQAAESNEEAEKEQEAKSIPEEIMQKQEETKEKEMFEAMLPEEESKAAIFEAKEETKKQAAEPEEKSAYKKADIPVLEEKRELKAKVSIGRKVKRFFQAEITIEDKDLAELLEELDLSLLESDVEQETAEEIIKEMKQRLAGKKISAKQKIDEEIKKEIRQILLEMMQTKEIDLPKEIKEKKPFKILFLGPNGAGKTTSMAKLTKFLQNKGLKVIWAAADTFRAASIEQLEKHAEKLNVRVVKHNYGADPAAVAFDAVKAAEAKKIDVVLIDSAGRQETNKNLMEELKKIARVIKPDLKIYVGESFTGQALLQQAEEYNKNLGIDGFILTKIDCDAKGGSTISLLYKIKKPILFVGTGQEYNDLKEFKPEFVLDKIF